MFYNIIIILYFYEQFTCICCIYIFVQPQYGKKNHQINKLMANLYTTQTEVSKVSINAKTNFKDLQTEVIQRAIHKM